MKYGIVLVELAAVTTAAALSTKPFVGETPIIPTGNLAATFSDDTVPATEDYAEQPQWVPEPKADIITPQLGAALQKADTAWTSSHSALKNIYGKLFRFQKHDDITDERKQQILQSSIAGLNKVLGGSNIALSDVSQACCLHFNQECDDDGNLRLKVKFFWPSPGSLFPMGIVKGPMRAITSMLTKQLKPVIASTSSTVMHMANDLQQHFQIAAKHPTRYDYGYGNYNEGHNDVINSGTAGTNTTAVIKEAQQLLANLHSLQLNTNELPGLYRERRALEKAAGKLQQALAKSAL